MLKIPLQDNTFVLELVSQGKNIEIKNGLCEGGEYHSLTFCDGALILEGDSPLLLARDEPAIYITVKGTLSRIAEILKDESVLVRKMDSIPEGREREVLKKLMD